MCFSIPYIFQKIKTMAKARKPKAKKPLRRNILKHIVIQRENLRLIKKLLKATGRED